MSEIHNTAAPERATDIALTAKGAAYCQAQTAPDLKTLLDRFARCDAEHCRMIEVTDSYLPHGTVPAEDEEAETEACKASMAAARAICLYRPLNDAEAIGKVQFLRDWWKDCGTAREEIECLLESMLPTDPNPIEEISRLALRIRELLPHLPQGAFDRCEIDRRYIQMSYARDFVDAELIALGEQFEAAWSHEKAIMAGDCGDWDAAYQQTSSMWEAAYEQTSSIVEQIERYRAHTVAGMRVKARCVQWCHGDDEVDLRTDQDTTNCRLANALVNDLLVIGGAHG